jgi:DNA-binding Lrp family transcriptional regulator
LREEQMAKKNRRGAGGRGFHADPDRSRPRRVVAKQLATLPGVLTAEYVTGPYDVIVRIGADTMERMQTDIVPGVQKISGITRTLTCPIASKAQP